MRAITRGRHTVRFTRDPEDVIAAQRLRFKAFIAARPGAAVTGDRAEGLDRDAYDDLCWHALVEDTEMGTAGAISICAAAQEPTHSDRSNDCIIGRACRACGCD